MKNYFNGPSGIYYNEATNAIVVLEKLKGGNRKKPLYFIETELANQNFTAVASIEYDSSEPVLLETT